MSPGEDTRNIMAILHEQWEGGGSGKVLSN